MKERKFKIEGMSCHHCVKAVQKELDAINVDSYEVEIGSAVVKYDETKMDERKIIGAIKEAGYKVV